jgi:hypothetical protein
MMSLSGLLSNAKSLLKRKLEVFNPGESMSFVLFKLSTLTTYCFLLGLLSVVVIILSSF